MNKEQVRNATIMEIVRVLQDAALHAFPEEAGIWGQAASLVLSLEDKRFPLDRPFYGE